MRQISQVSNRCIFPPVMLREIMYKVKYSTKFRKRIYPGLTLPLAIEAICY